LKTGAEGLANQPVVLASAQPLSRVGI